MQTSTNLYRQVVLVIVPYLVTIALIVFVSLGSADILSDVRAYVGGESLWSKAEKEAVIQLEQYATSGDDAFFGRYLEAIRIPLGDRTARLELEREAPDLRMARQGFLDGGNHPDDIAGIIRLYQRFHNVEFMQRIILLWTEADGQIDEIIAAANELRAAFAQALSSQPSGDVSHADPARMQHALQRLRVANTRAASLAAEFSSSLGETSRMMRQVIQAGIITLTLILLVPVAIFSARLLVRYSGVERALRTSEERFDLAVRGSNDGIWNWGIHARAVYLSPRAAELLGSTPEQTPTDPLGIAELVAEEDREMFRSAVLAMLNRNTPLEIEFRVPLASGSHRWLQMRGRALQVIDGTATQVAGAIADISERKCADATRRSVAEEEQRNAERAQIAMLEQVQGRIGRELHDDLGQRLTGVAFLAKALEQRLGKESPTEKDQTAWIVKLINEAIDRVRFLSRQLSPIAIDEVTLGTALKRLVEDVHDIFGTNITLDVAEEDGPISGADASQFFHIAQEAINNALRHGQATRIRVYLGAYRHGARVAILDNGKGFSTKRVDRKASLGLRSMAIRAETLRGRLRIRSTTQGTLVIVRSYRCLQARRRRIGADA
jgi:PAS domain S-box-containing protein